MRVSSLKEYFGGEGAFWWKNINFGIIGENSKKSKTARIIVDIFLSLFISISNKTYSFIYLKYSKMC
jgi:hypothetical protein